MSTPEILERVHTIESEILQIEEAIAIQGNNSVGVSSLSIYLLVFYDLLTLVEGSVSIIMHLFRWKKTK